MATSTFNSRIKHKRDTSANWTANNPVLLNGEIILVDTASGDLRFKVGDGTSTYTQLPFTDEPLRSLISDVSDDIPTATSDLTNDSGFITSSDIPEEVFVITTPTGTTTYADTLAAYNAGKFIYLKNGQFTLPLIQYTNNTFYFGYVNSVTNNSSAHISTYTLTSTGLSSAGTTVPPQSHATSATTYGVGTGLTYGHLKLSDSTTSTSSTSAGIAATPAAVKAVADAIPTATSDLTNDSGFITISDVPDSGTVVSLNVWTA